MRPYDPEQPLIFIHVPKCGGRSVRELVRGWFGDHLVQHYASNRSKTLPVPQDLEQVHSPARPVCVYGHFNRARGFGVEDSYPQARQFVTILRDPFEQIISLYYWMRRPDVPWREQVPDWTLGTHIDRTQSEMLLHFPRVMTRDNFRDLIEEYFIEIGLLEELPRSLLRIADRLGQSVDPTTLQRLNATPRDAQYEDVEELRADFMARNQLEYDVYNHVRARFAATGDPQTHPMTGAQP